jgi:RHS repeat-associated protein
MLPRRRRWSRLVTAFVGLTVVAYGLPAIAPHSGLLADLVPPAAAAAVPATGEFQPLPLTRILDTRNGTGGITGPLSGGQTVNVTVLGRGGLPTTGVQAVAVSIAAVSASTTGFLTAWPTGQARPAITTLSTHTQGATSVTAMVRPGTGGQVSVWNNAGTVHLLMDVVGYITDPTATSAGTTFVPLAPARIFDTRDGMGGVTGPVAAGATVSMQVTGVGGVPTSGVTAVALNLAATSAAADSFLRAWPTGATMPSASSMNYVTEGTTEVMQVVQVGTGGKVSIYSNASTQVFAEVLGYFVDPAASGSGDLFVPVTSAQILDTRNGTGGITGPLSGGQTVTLTVRGVAGVPTTRVSAVAMALTSTAATVPTYLTAWASGAAKPSLSTVQARPGVNQTNLVYIPVGADGKVAFASSATSVHLVGDVVGYFSDNNPPGAVDKRSMTPGDSADVGTTTPTLHSQYTDPDGDQGYVAYEVINPQTGGVVSSGRGPTVVSGADSPWTVPAGLGQGATYRWRSRAVDGKGGAGSWSATKYFNTQNTSQTGEQRRFSFEERDLTDRMQLKANVANGNVLLHATDLQIRGTGIDFTLDRYYNSKVLNVSALGKGWTLGIGHDVKLLLAATNPTTSDVTYVAPSGFTGRFSFDSGGFRHPPGIDADLSWSSSANEWSLKFHKSEGKYVFDSTGRFARIEDRNGNKIRLGYNGSGLLSTVTDTQDRVTTFGYLNGRLDAVTDPTGRTVRYTYDAGGNLETVTDAAGQLVRFRYNGDLVDQVTTGGNSITRIDYVPDGSRRVVDFFTQFDPGNGVPTSATTSFEYLSGKTRVTDPNGNNTTGDGSDGITTYEYDDRDRVEKVIDALGHEQDKEYTGNDNISMLTDALQKQVTLTWDPNDENLTSVGLPTGAKSTFDYTNSSHPHSVSKTTDAQGNTMSYSYDSPGNETAEESSQYPGTKIEQRFYNGNGTVDYILDGNGTKTDFSYDGKGNLTAVDNPAPLGDVSITPDALSRLRTQVDGKGQTMTRTYDPIDGPDVITFSGGTSVECDYDADGNLVEVTDQTGTTTFAYNKVNRQIRKTTPDAMQIRYEYDHNGNLRKLTDASGDVVYTYNQVNLLQELLEPGTAAPVRFEYDDNNRRTKVTFPTSPATVVTMSYDDSGRQKTAKAVAGTTTLTDFSYSYTKNGADTALRQSMTDAGATTNYGYDGLNRLTSASGAMSRGYGYDVDFNRTSKTVDGITTNYGYNAANQLTTVDAATTFSYDNNGNLTGGGGWALAYNSQNQTTSIQRPGGAAMTPLTYAGEDQTERRLAGPVTFATSQLGVIRATTPADTTVAGDVGVPGVEETDLSKPPKGQTVYYTRDADGGLISMRAGAARYYYLLDGLGSVVGLVNTAGVKVNSYRYDPYGEQIAASQQVANPWRFASGEFDGQTGLTKFGARYYDPTYGRFTQRDPSGKDLSYAYGSCNPVNFTDPTGLEGSWGDSSCIISLVGLAASIIGFEAAVLATPVTGVTAFLAVVAYIGLLASARGVLDSCPVE